MKEDKETKTVNKVYDPDEHGRAGSERVEGLKGERVEKKTGKDKIFKISLWIGIPTIAIVIILWVVHNWFGYWLVKIELKYDFAYKPCEWMKDNLPFWIIGKGSLQASPQFFPYQRKDAPEYLFGYLDHNDINIRTGAWGALSMAAWYYPQNIPKNTLFLHIVEGIHYKDTYTPRLAIRAFRLYNKSMVDSSADYPNKIVLDVIASENNPVVKEDYLRIMKNQQPIDPIRGNKELEENLHLLIKVLREYHKKNEKP